MPKRGPKCKLGYHRVFNLILWVLYTGMQWKCLPIPHDPNGIPAIHYTTIYKVFAKWADDGSLWHAFFETHADRLSIEQLPAYSPDFNPIEHLWKKVKKEATHLKHFPEFMDLQQEVDRALLHFAQTTNEITVLMARYCEKLGKVDKAA
jgi:hypothetical protein